MSARSAGLLGPGAQDADGNWVWLKGGWPFTILICFYSFVLFLFGHNCSLHWSPFHVSSRGTGNTPLSRRRMTWWLEVCGHGICVGFRAAGGSKLSKCRRKGNIWGFKKWWRSQIMCVCVHTLTLSQTHTHTSLFIQNIRTYRFVRHAVRFCLASYKSNVIKTLHSCGVFLCYILSKSHEWEHPLEQGARKSC